MLSDSRVVARIVSSGQAPRRVSANRAQASTRCSQLSSTRSSRRGRNDFLQGLQERAAGFFADAERRGGHLRHQGGIGQRRQCGEPHAIGESPRRPGRAPPERQPGLTYAAGAGQRQQPRPGRAGAPTSASSRARPTKLLTGTGTAWRGLFAAAGGRVAAMPEMLLLMSLMGGRYRDMPCVPQAPGSLRRRAQIVCPLA